MMEEQVLRNSSKIKYNQKSIEEIIANHTGGISETAARANTRRSKKEKLHLLEKKKKIKTESLSKTEREKREGDEKGTAVSSYMQRLSL